MKSSRIPWACRLLFLLPSVACSAAQDRSCTPSHAGAQPTSTAEPGTPAVANAPSPPASTVAAEGQPRIEFDCASALPDHRGESLRGWKSGGPSGAAWNWYGGNLSCTVNVTAACQGEGTLRIFAGAALGASGRVSFRNGEPVRVELDVEERTWKAALSPPASNEPYETLLLVARIDAACAADGDTGGYPWHGADAFIAGFSGGE